MARRLLWVLVGALAGFLLGRRRGGEAEQAPQLAPASPAGELRHKLEQARGRRTPPSPPPAEEEDVDSRRRRVHEQGRSALEEMRRFGAGEEPPR
jgi:hypothetical protein